MCMYVSVYIIEVLVMAGERIFIHIDGDGDGDGEDEEQEEPWRREIPFLGPSSSSSSAPPPPSGPPVQKEHLFDKVVTPSDVGKLNRLVIPKQHAERHFPLDPAANDKGLLLAFDDPGGKQWRFRYSYWNSSQSYVMTKGWSRFVKEKRLDAGDTVSFYRGGDKLFIDWRRRADVLRDAQRHLPPPALLPSPWGALARGGGFFMSAPAAMPATLHELQYQQRRRQGFGFGAPPPPANPSTILDFYNPGRAALPVMPSRIVPPMRPIIRGVPATTAFPVVLDSMPVGVSAPAASKKRFRLFGVNLSCGESSSTSNAPAGNPPPLQLLEEEPSPRGTMLLDPSTSAASTPSSSASKKEAASLDLDL